MTPAQRRLLAAVDAGKVYRFFGRDYLNTPYGDIRVDARLRPLRRTRAVRCVRDDGGMAWWRLTDEGRARLAATSPTHETAPASDATAAGAQTRTETGS